MFQQMILFVYIIGTLPLILCSGVTAIVTTPRYSVVERLHKIPDDWTDIGTPPSSKLMKFQLTIHQEEASGLEQKVIDISTPGSSNYGHYMSREELRSMLHPSDVASQQVLSWLEAAHISAASIEAHANWITFTVSVSQAEQLLKTRFYTFEHKKSKATVVRTLKYSVPKEIRSFVQMIQPTTRFGHLVAQAMPPPLLGAAPVTLAELAANCSSIATPDCLRELYGIPDSQPKSDPRNRLGVSGFLDQYARYSDFHRFLHLYAPNMTEQNFTVVLINGGLNLQHSSEISSEASLDIQYAAALADNAFTTFYSTAGRGPFMGGVGDNPVSDSDHEPYLEQLQYLLDLPDEELPAVLSTSYGELEQNVPETYAKVTCNMFAQLGARGVSVIFSSGDSGVGETCISKDGTQTRFQPLFPASCPFVTSVGGTYGREPEKAIRYSAGGFSEYFPRPSYQHDSVDHYLHQLGSKWEGLYNPNGRAIPDVAAQADHFIIMDHGHLRKTGGTSAAAPVFAAIVSRLNAARLADNKPRLGFLNPWLYSLNQSGFTDILDGGSEGCFGDVRSEVPYASWNATPGWDPVTGLGTPYYQTLVELAMSI